MAYKREYLQYVTVAANTNPQEFILNTPDNFQEQRIKTLFVGATTARLEVGIGTTGRIFSSVDASWFAVGEKELFMDVTVRAGNAPEITITDHAGTGHANLAIMIGYEVDQA